jgi:hypothetical protein
MLVEYAACLINLTKWLDALSFILLAIPAIVFARLAASTSDFIKLKLDPKRVHEVFVQKKNEADEAAWAKIGKWEPWHNKCLYLGLLIAVVSHIIKLST